MVRNIISVVAGYAIWTAIFLGGAALVRSLIPSVFDDAGMTDDNTALVCFLIVSIVASLVCGWVAAKVAVSYKIIFGWILAGCLLATGIPVQLSAWDQLPVWYNLSFLILLVPVTMIGVKFGAGPS